MDVSPSLVYHYPQAAIDFLERAFGFERGTVIEDGDTVAHAELFHGDSCVMVGGERDDDLGRPAGSGWSYVVVSDTDAHYARAKAMGAEIVMEPTDTDYGSRDYAALDPEGNKWNFGTYRPSRP